MELLLAAIAKPKVVLSMKNIVITGASAGIGAAIAKLLSKEDVHLILLARRIDKLEKLRQEIGLDKVSAFELDVTSHSDVKEVFNRIEREIGSIDVLVNNAGGAFGLDRAQEASFEDWEKCVDVNIKGLMYCTHQVLPGMVKLNQGYIINIGSTAAHYPYPGGHVYGGAKAFVHQFSLNLRADLLGTKVRVTCVEPGITGGTEFSLVRFHGDEVKAKKVYEKTEPLRPEDVANVIHFCLSLPAHVNINSIEMMPTMQAFSPLAVHRI